MNHPTTPPWATTVEELGTQVAQLRYDALIVFVRALKTELECQRSLDAQRGRHKLATSGFELVRALGDADRALEAMLSTSLPYMEESVHENPLLLHPYTRT